MTGPTRGVLHLVVGPSGAGKDALIAAIRPVRPDIHYPRRIVSRPAMAGLEDHDSVGPETFERDAAAGAYALCWRAHGLGYGVPRDIEDALASGRHVVVNVSRSVIDEARARFAPVRVLRVDASPETLARRVAGRGRESADEVAARLSRKSPAEVSGPDVYAIDNDGLLADAVHAMLDALAPAHG
jgi:ribose 1,5-bisphosphokinase